MDYLHQRAPGGQPATPDWLCAVQMAAATLAAAATTHGITAHLTGLAIIVYLLAAVAGWWTA